MKTHITQSSPWHTHYTGHILWLRAPLISEKPVVHWAKTPLWVDALSGKEFPLCAMQPLPEFLTRWLPVDYILTDFDTPLKAQQFIMVKPQGLYNGNTLIDWLWIKPFWPAIVLNASRVEYKQHSPTMAMSLWLNRIDHDGKLPFYVPPKAYLQPDGEPSTEYAQHCRQAAIEDVERYYSAQISANLSKLVRFRKLRKLVFYPNQFFSDAWHNLKHTDKQKPSHFP